MTAANRVRQPIESKAPRATATEAAPKSGNSGRGVRLRRLGVIEGQITHRDSLTAICRSAIPLVVTPGAPAVHQSLRILPSALVEANLQSRGGRLRHWSFARTWPHDQALLPVRLLRGGSLGGNGAQRVCLRAVFVSGRESNGRTEAAANRIRHP